MQHVEEIYTTKNTLQQKTAEPRPVAKHPLTSLTQYKPSILPDITLILQIAFSKIHDASQARQKKWNSARKSNNEIKMQGSWS